MRTAPEGLLRTMSRLNFPLQPLQTDDLTRRGNCYGPRSFPSSGIRLVYEALSGADARSATAWPSIKERQHTLIAAPTGSGKTLAAFLAAIDDLVVQGVAGGLDDTTHVVYVSPLKALGNDIDRNLQTPLEGIEQELKAMGLPAVNIRTLVRSGDTPASQRTAMSKRPPHILVTTPESLHRSPVKVVAEC